MCVSMKYISRLMKKLLEEKQIVYDAKQLPAHPDRISPIYKPKFT